MVAWLGSEDLTNVNAELTENRGSRPGGRSDNAAYLSFVRRVLRGYARRVGSGDTDDLPELVSLRSEVDELITRAVRELRVSAGLSWAQIAAGLGVTRQAAQQRYGGDHP
jgi:hypothetical protein